MAHFGGVYTFGDNSAENEPIWMKSGALWVHCWALALAFFGMIREVVTAGEPGKILFLSIKQCTISLIFLSAKFHEIWTKTSIGVAMKNFGTEF